MGALLNTPLLMSLHTIGPTSVSTQSLAILADNRRLRRKTMLVLSRLFQLLFIRLVASTQNSTHRNLHQHERDVYHLKKSFLSTIDLDEENPTRMVPCDQEPPAR